LQKVSSIGSKFGQRYQALELNFVKGIKHWNKILPKIASIETKFCKWKQALEQNFAKGIKH